MAPIYVVQIWSCYDPKNLMLHGHVPLTKQGCVFLNDTEQSVFPRVKVVIHCFVINSKYFFISKKGF